MNNNIKRDICLLIGIVFGCAFLARFLAHGKTLEEYAKTNGLVSSASSSVSTIEKEEKSEKQETANSAITTDIDTTKSTVEISSDSSSVTVTPDASSPEKDFYYEPLSDDIIERIYGISYVENDNIKLEDLAYCKLLYNNFNGDTCEGEMICNKKIADDIIDIFKVLYENGYQIESIKLIDEFNGDDEASMLANNTSCFNYRVVENTTHLSKHAYGLAVDINPFYNPYITYNKDGTSNISPEGSEAYADRAASFPYKIDENDLAYKLFTSHGFKWGGNWNSVKDYQHFEGSK